MMYNKDEGLMQWKRQPNGKLKLIIKDKGETVFKPFQQSVMFTPVPVERSQFGSFTPGFRTAQIALKNGYKYIPTGD